MKKKLGLTCLIMCLMLSACGSTSNVQTGENDTYTEAPAQGNSVEGTNSTSATAPGEGTANLEAIPTEPITLNIYSQLSSWWGEQEGWFAELMLDKFNVKLNYVLHWDEETSYESGTDIIIFGASTTYLEAVEKGQLLDWEANGLLEEHGAYILENMSKALEYNRSLTPDEGKIFGFGHNVATSVNDCEDFFLTWDIRWDLYKELGYPQVQDLDDMVQLFEDMKVLCSTDENGEETYAISLWPDWDQNMMMYAKCLATAYYGYDEQELGLYDTETGTFHGALEENGPYLEMLKFLNSLYRKGLLDPDSRTQSYEDMLVKLEAGGTFFSVFNYAGSMAYNTEGHLGANQYMASLVPDEASPATYGLSVFGGGRTWAISANTQYPELCMEIINWLCTPEGRLTCEYGPKGVSWDYDEEGNTYFTEEGRIWFEEKWLELPDEFGGYSFWGGTPQLNNTTWSLFALNPDSNGETYDYQGWKSNLSEASCDMEQDWRDYTGASTVNEYIKSKNYVAIPEVNYEPTEKRSELEMVWKLVTECIVSGSWDAVYAETEKEFAQIVSEMRTEAEELGYETCMSWCEYEAMRRDKLEDAVREK